jgi:hypothetical protein
MFAVFSGLVMFFGAVVALIFLIVFLASAFERP